MHSDSISAMSNIQDTNPTGHRKDGHAEKETSTPDDASYHVVSHHGTVTEMGNVVDPVLNAKIHLVNEVGLLYP